MDPSFEELGSLSHLIRLFLITNSVSMVRFGRKINAMASGNTGSPWNLSTLTGNECTRLCLGLVKESSRRAPDRME